MIKRECHKKKNGERKIGRGRRECIGEKGGRREAEWERDKQIKRKLYRKNGTKIQRQVICERWVKINQSNSHTLQLKEDPSTYSCELRDS